MSGEANDGGITIHVRGSVMRAKINGTWHEGDPYHRVIVTAGEFDQDTRQWDQPPVISWQRVAKEDWRPG